MQAGTTQLPYPAVLMVGLHLRPRIISQEVRESK